MKGRLTEKELARISLDPQGYALKAKINQKAMESYASAQRSSARAQSSSLKYKVYSENKYLLWWTILILVIIGPGTLAALNIVSSLNIYMWLGLAFMGILIWRNW